MSIQAREGVVVAVILGLLALFGLSVAGRDAAEGQRDTALTQAKVLGRGIVDSDVCQSGDPVDEVKFGYLCAQARRVVAAGAPSQVDVDALAALVTSMVMTTAAAGMDEVVAAYLQAHPPAPGAPASLEQITGAVADYLTAHPPDPGRPTPDELAAAVADYLGRNPPGPAITERDVGAAVAGWFADHPVNPCPGLWEPYLYADGRTGWRCLTP